MLLVKRQKGGLGLIIDRVILRVTKVVATSAVLTVEQDGEKTSHPLVPGQNLLIGQSSVRLLKIYRQRQEVLLAISAPQETVIERESYLPLPQRR